MCTLLILRRPDHDWPLLVGANRDERPERPWQAPDRHWPERPEVVAPRDELAGGSWFGMNRYGLVAAVANRDGTVGPEEGRRSRGELVLEALEHAEVETAAEALADLEPASYRPFNLFVGGPTTAFWIAHTDDDMGVLVREVPPGPHILTTGDLDESEDPRIELHLPRLRRLDPPDPESGDWRAWTDLLGSRLHPENEPGTAVNLDREDFATVCSQLAAVPRYPGHGVEPVFLFAAGPPDRVEMEKVPIPE